MFAQLVDHEVLKFGVICLYTRKGKTPSFQMPFILYDLDLSILRYTQFIKATQNRRCATFTERMIMSVKTILTLVYPWASIVLKH